MDRRAFLVGAGSAVGSLAGCVALDGGRGDEGGVAERALPERPADPTPESVAEHVAAYEEVRTHNHYARAGATEVSVDAVATFDHASGDDHYATAQHAGTVSIENDGDRSVGELHSRPVPYLVAPDRTLRMGTDRRRVRTGESGRADDETTEPPLGVRLLNVGDEPRDLTVTVVRRSDAGGGRTAGDSGEADGAVNGGNARGSDGDETGAVLTTTVTVDPGRAVELLGVTAVRGGYRITAATEDNGVTAEGRIEVGLPSADRGPNVDVVVDHAEVSTWHLPSFETI